MLRVIYRAAAIAVISVFAWLPPLARIHDRLTASDHSSSFRLSKNIERPHEKQVAQALVRAVPTRVSAVLCPGPDLVAPPVLPLRSVASAPAPLRAPPTT